MFSKEDYDDWKIRMQANLAAQDDDMWSVITDGPMKIMKINIAFATTDGAPKYVEKRRHEYTNEEKKKANLDNVRPRAHIRVKTHKHMRKLSKSG
ncbi:hypothetical protein F511_35969 [Dorcoceras hygrometricum]|uniref:DUF4219 domain-containing protein n=1 Tax=Dorcoceras hygrometricum TaxID=472368 RepID=A0A2Z7BCP0_9LAMI|nr:hypothetical protein F511_35969 [Dorcoceras hygrometricum]